KAAAKKSILMQTQKSDWQMDSARQTDRTATSVSITNNNMVTTYLTTIHFWHLTELPDISRASIACNRCLSISSISSKDGNSKGSFNTLVLMYHFG
ncbi:MAG: hypothetical protein ACJ708_11030, partial [Nitrososphaeraceae archaeon]